MSYRHHFPEKLWLDRAAKVSFWSLNIGLAWVAAVALGFSSRTSRRGDAEIPRWLPEMVAVTELCDPDHIASIRVQYTDTALQESLYSAMFRRSLILALALSIAGLALAPDVLCAFMCARSGQMPCCESLSSLVGLQNRVGESSSDTTAACEMACTFLTAPLQISQQADPGSALQRVVLPAAVERDIVLINRSPVPLVQFQDTSPPPLQALLCSFLI